MSKNYNLIIADDDTVITNLLQMKAKHYGFRPIAVDDGHKVIDLIHSEVEVILLDLHMPTLNGLDCLRKINEQGINIPVIILSAETEASVAMQAVKLGAHDYLTKPFDLDELFTTLRNAKKLSQVQQENNALKEQLIETVSDQTSQVQIIANSLVTQKIQRTALKIATLDSTVLLTGESGTGKTMYARYIHANSPRADKPFVTVSCPALPRELLESELFGHEKGAFTGAIKRRIGKLESAAGGTLFLDEIGDLPLDLQPKLLNVLQDQEFTRIGSNEIIKTDVRIIVASNVDFTEKIKRKEFREDLYYRISVIPLEIPPLREQKENIIPLSEHVLKQIATKNKTQQPLLSDATKVLIESYEWPGNIRQLQNVLERASAFADDYSIQPEDLPHEISTEQSSHSEINGLAGYTLAEVEKEAILQTLSYCQGNKAETARQLGITEKSIYNKMKRHNLIES